MHGGLGEQGKLPLFSVVPTHRQPSLTHVRPEYVSSGLEVLDAALDGGLRCGAMSLVASRACVGSMSLLIGAALSALEQGLTVLYVTDRVKDEPMRGRLMVCQSKVNGYRFRAGVASESDYEKLWQASEDIAWERLKLISRRAVSLDEVDELTTELKPHLIVADFEPGRTRDGKRPGYRPLKRGFESLATLGQTVGAALLVRHVFPLGTCAPDRLELPGLGTIAELFDSVVLLHREVEPTGENTGTDVDAQVIRLRLRDIRPRRVSLLLDQRFGGLSSAG